MLKKGTLIAGKPITWIAAFAAVVAVAAVAAVTLTSSTGAAQPQVTPSYQPFTATITHWVRDEQGRHPEGITEMFKVEYRDAHDWTVTETMHSADPQYVGSQRSFKGNTATSYDATTKANSSRTIEENSVNVPDRWLVPGLEAQLTSHGWTKTSSGAYERTSSRSVENLRFDGQGRPLTFEVRSEGVVRERATYQYPAVIP